MVRLAEGEFAALACKILSDYKVQGIETHDGYFSIIAS